VEDDTQGNGNLKSKQRGLIVYKVSEVKTVCEHGMKNASRLSDVLANLIVEDMWLDRPTQTFDRDSNFNGHIAKVRRTVFTIIPTFKPYTCRDRVYKHVQTTVPNPRAVNTRNSNNNSTTYFEPYALKDNIVELG
jgi:hypothetical protein